MTKTTRSPKYIVSDQWNSAYENGLLIFSAGADKIFAIPDIQESTAREVLALWDTPKINPSVLSPPALEVFEQLKSALIVKADLPRKTRYKISLRYIGDAIPSLQSQTEAQLSNRFEITPEDNYDLLVIIRTNGLLQDIIKNNYEKILSPHLLLDAAYDHVISIGPLVFPGDTACLSCLVGRLTTYWGDANPPKLGAIQKSPALIASILIIEVEKILPNYGRELVNNTVAYDFENYSVKKNSVYKLPMCPVCGRGLIDNPGSIKLPWLQKT